MKTIKPFRTVFWEHTMPLWYGKKRKEEMFGVVIKIYETIVGGRKKEKVAKISVSEHKYWHDIGKKTTVIKLDKLKLL